MSKVLGKAGKVKMVSITLPGFRCRAGYSDKNLVQGATCRVSFMAPDPLNTKVVGVNATDMAVIRAIKSKYIAKMYTFHLAPLGG